MMAARVRLSCASDINLHSALNEDVNLKDKKQKQGGGEKQKAKTKGKKQKTQPARFELARVSAIDF